MPKDLNLAKKYCALHNAGLRAGDFSELVPLFAEDAELRFELSQFGPFHGRKQIAQAFATKPPKEELEAMSISRQATDGGKISFLVAYKWSAENTSKPGLFSLLECQGQIEKLVVHTAPIAFGGMGNNGPKILQTENLILRRWRKEDLKPFAELNSCSYVMEHFPFLLSEAESNAMAERIDKRFDTDGLGLWAVELKANGDFTGFVGLSRPKEEMHFTPCVEIGWRLAHKYWGRGIAPEAAKACLKDGFERLEIAEIVAMTAACNSNSRRVMEKIGMLYDPADDFLHPAIATEHRLNPHVLYRIKK